jgi:hypothetical protein
MSTPPFLRESRHYIWQQSAVMHAYVQNSWTPVLRLLLQLVLVGLPYILQWSMVMLKVFAQCASGQMCGT